MIRAAFAIILPLLIMGAMLGSILAGCAGDGIAPRPGSATAAPPAPALPPAPSTPSATPAQDAAVADAAGRVARLQAELADARGALAAAKVAQVEAARAARLAPIQAACTWAAWIGGAVALVCGALWIAAAWWSVPVARPLLGGLAIAGAGLAVLALSLGESLPWIVRLGPWLLGVAALGFLAWLVWRLVRAAHAGWQSSTVLGEALRTAAPALHEHLTEGLAQAQDGSRMRDLGRSMRRRFEPAAGAMVRAWQSAETATIRRADTDFPPHSERIPATP
jgi:hypothetical protein